VAANTGHDRSAVSGADGNGDGTIDTFILEFGAPIRSDSSSGAANATTIAPYQILWLTAIHRPTGIQAVVGFISMPTESLQQVVRVRSESSSLSNESIDQRELCSSNSMIPARFS